MFTDLDDAFSALRERVPHPPFAPASAVRRRGRRRTRRQVAVAGIAVVGAVVAAGALVTGPLAVGPGEHAAGVTGSTPAAAQTGRTEDATRPDAAGLAAVRAEFPDRLFLAPDDLPGLPHRGDGPTIAPSWPTLLMCEVLDDDWYSSLPLARPGRTVGYRAEAPDATAGASGGPYVIQSVRRYREDGAVKAIANIDAFQVCRTHRGHGDRELARDFGGDQSRLYLVPPFDPRSDLPRHLIYVRVGDLLTEVELYGVVDDAGARTLAATVAERLGDA